VTRKFRPIFGKKWPNNAEISTLKLDLKAKNILIEPNLKPLNTCNKPSVETIEISMVETACLIKSSVK
jgi:hypothetical protein